MTSMTFVAIVFAVCQSSKVEAFGLVEMISDYAKVAKNSDRSTMDVQYTNISTTLPAETTTEPPIDYQDFDDLQEEEEDRSLKQTTSTETMMKYFNGLVSLLALMYKFNGNFGGVKPSKLHFKNQNEPRDKNIAKEINNLQDTGKQFQVAQDRFEFPQKKFRYHENQISDNMIDQQYQPVENYPPYNPLKANTAETYNNDKETSYDADLKQYDLTHKNSLNGYSPDVEIHQSHSYEIPYASSQPSKTSSYDLTKDDSTPWNNQNSHPVYNPWMTKTPAKDQSANDENYYQGWNVKAPPQDTPTHAKDSYKPWNEKPLDFPIYHHDFKDIPQSEYHEIEHPADEDRVSKKPYSYYFLGRKLWYIPLLFSVYFIIYVGALVLKSVARHKIQFPEKIWNLHDDHLGHAKRRRHRKVDDITENYEKAVEKMTNKFM